MSTPRTIDGRTLMVLSSWCAVLVVSVDSNNWTRARLMLPDEQHELRSALANVKHAMEHVKLEVSTDA